ncbi:MAG TPA: SGNH/GDSL hydrolase family protein [Armatimonadota bacterium]|jgi:lysophospholipase L1-like esterase
MSYRREIRLCYLLLALLSVAPLCAADTNSGGHTVMGTQPAAVVATGHLLDGVKRIVFVGDSITDGSAWPDWIGETLKQHGHPGLLIFNAGVAGNTSHDVQVRYATDVLALKPDLVVLMIGTNDASGDVPVDTYRQHLEEIAAATHRAGSRLLFLTPPWYPNVARNATVYTYDMAIRGIAQRYGDTVVDVHLAFERALAAGQPVIPEDNVHPIIDGWRLLARCVLDTLGCPAPLVEQTSLYPKSLTDWFISPPVAWKMGTPTPQPDLSDTFDPIAAGWEKFDRPAEIKQTSWWQESWLQRGGIMPAGNPTRLPDAGAFACTTVQSHGETVTLHVGGSTPLLVWLNGKLVCDGKNIRGYHPDADRLPVTLRKGTNRIIVFSTWLFLLSLGEI